ncbi:MAG: type IV pilin protein [Colwellia sp.]|nr:type IV pilin protein [Colwellia sp.]MCW8863961.1 type IV pilin protein [Colwellia sp.]MCW9080100.1 type IV pilin protein [Colwellia sp.]
MNTGFSLIELLIAVAIVGILAAVAYPSYTSFVLTSNRAEGQRELLRLANLQEETFIDRRSYTTNMTDLGMANDPHITEYNNYSIDATIANGGSTFILTATAQGAQTSDAGCTALTVNEAGQKLPAACWRQ